MKLSPLKEVCSKNETYWEEFYKKPFTLEPSDFARFCLERFTRRSKIIELGSGNGRDTYFLAGHHEVYGVDWAVKPPSKDNPVFIQEDLAAFLTKRNQKFDGVYARFLLHAVEKELADNLMEWAYESLSPGGLLMIEARSVKDDSFVADHYRRPVENSGLLKQLKETGFHIDYFKEGNGMAVFNGQDPVVIRVIAKKGNVLPIAQTKTDRLRSLLLREEVVAVAGAHSALSAKLVQEAGFDAIWASGFEISTLRGVPDANILSMAELLEVAQQINEAAAIPVIADCDNGFGNAINVIRTVSEYEKAGIAAICIEDSVFPKRCSFYSGVKRELVSIEEHAGKIRAAKKAQKDPDFVVIARTEALIAGWGLDEALKRATAYAEAGADAILIHSKSNSADEVKAFAASWKNSCPLIAVPTTYHTTTLEDLGDAGFKVVIFANHAMRASIRAMRETLKTLRKAGRASAVENSIVSLEEVYELIGLSELRSDEKEFLPQETEKQKAVIVAAGFESNFLPLIQDRPKGMLEINGKTILERQIAALRNCQINDISIVRGYKAEVINLPDVRYYEHPTYDQGYVLSSFFRAEKEMDGPLLFLYADILFEKGVLEKLLSAEEDIRLVIDRSWLDSPTSQNPNRKPELVVTSQVPPRSHRFISSMELEEKNQILKIGRDLSRSESHGEFIGMAFFSKKGCRILREIYHQAENKYRQGPFQDAPDFAHASFSGMMQEIINNGVPITAVEIYKGWIEIDTLEDYYHARKVLNP